MAWEWSHTDEAYSNAREQVEALPRAELLTILREWAYHDREQAGRLRGRAIGPSGRVRGFRLPAGMRRLTADVLVDLIWSRMEEQRTCTNGGWAAYCCPDGCHTVPFDPVDLGETGATGAELRARVLVRPGRSLRAGRGPPAGVACVIAPDPFRSA